MKNLPIGIQTLTEIRRRNCIYVDKTQLVHQLVTTGKYYFLSRPRRFGKSLLVSTLKELYQGNKAVFEGLWVENNWDWTKIYPVLHFSFDTMGYVEAGLMDVLKTDLEDKAKLFDVVLEKTDLKGLFKELIDKVSEKHGKIVVLVDEYDKPIIDFLETATVETAKANRDVLREFYGILKNADEHLELVFITGISKFSKVSIFSHLNNLKDISLSKNYAALTGYTQEELEFNFAEHIQKCTESLEIDKETLLQQMKIWYNGYSWDGKTKVYNPFGTLNFLDDQEFKNYWFATGSPRFLIEQMRTQVLYNVENAVVNNTILDKYDLDNLTLIPLLFQSGYLTVKSSDPMTGDLVLDYPNKEVRESMYQFLIDDLSRNQQRTHTGMTINELKNAFVSRDLEQVQSIINALLADLPSETYIKQTEGLYHGLIHLIFKYLGVFVDSEVHSSQGRADAVVQTLTDVYVFEFKFNKTAQAGIDQINKKNYAAKYKASGKMITGIGVNFDSEIKQINDWMEVIL
jgi:Predicted AAA-ATPase/PD-(D/E)XK nuclease superfamily